MKSFIYPRDFKGVWIPKEVWLHGRLSAVDKIIFTEIWSLDGGEGCYASNEYLADFCRISLATLKRALAHLEELELIQKAGYRGRCRVWTTRLKMSQVLGSKRAEYPAQNEPPVDTVRSTQEKEKTAPPALKVFDAQAYYNKLKKELIEAEEAGDLPTMIMKGMELMNEHPFSNYSREWVAAKQLCDKIKTVGNGHKPVDFFRGILRAYLSKKRGSKQEYWKGAPLTPSAINSRFDQVLEFVHKKVAEEEDNGPLKEMLKRRRA